MNEDPYSPPSSDPDDQRAASPTPGKQGFPFLLVLRWILAFLAVAIGISESVFYLSNWASLVDQAYSHPIYHPLPSVLLATLHVLGGAMLFARSPWCIPLFALHFIAYVAKFLMAAGFSLPPPTLVIYLGIDALTVWLCLYSWAHSQSK